jgi:hypothetical protein
MSLADDSGVVVLVMQVAVSMLTVLGTSAGAAAVRAPQGEGTGKWQQAMEQLRVPGKGCFTAAYPKVEWFRTTCKAAPRHPCLGDHCGERTGRVGRVGPQAVPPAAAGSAMTGASVPRLRPPPGGARG